MDKPHPVPWKHIRHQGAVLATLGRVALGLGRKSAGDIPQLPGSEFSTTLPARPPELLHDYIIGVGGDPARWEGFVPHHFFPQWTFPLLTRCLSVLPYDFKRVLNAGCRVEVGQPLPAGEPLQVRVRLEEVDDNGRRAVITARCITGTASVPDALVVYQTVLIPLPRKGKDKDSAPKKEPVLVPTNVRLIRKIHLSARAGLEFALLTGDFNPLHWLRPWARASGHPTPILHGFSSMARSLEAVHNELWGGDHLRMMSYNVRFTNPLRLPGEVGVFVNDDNELYMGGAVGGKAFLAGSFTEKPASSH